MKIAVGIATYRRRGVLSDTLLALQCQTRSPERLLVSATREEDVDLELCQTIGAEVLISQAGSCRQRNAILRDLSDEDIIVFFDDDFIPRDDYLANVEQIFQDEQIAVATGTLVGDDARGPGFSLEEANLRIERSRATPASSKLSDYHSGYGCNMALDARLIRQSQLEFDERLPLYGWMEDMDFTRRLAKSHRIVRTGLLTGVHRAVKSGRVSGCRFGYSQIVNPVYLARKGTCNKWFALTSIGKYTFINLIKLLRPEKHIDRRGRLSGNLLAISHLARGKIDPEYVNNL